MWINPEDSKVYKLHSDIRAAFPNISMPSELSDVVIESLGLSPVSQTLKPHGYVVEEAAPTLIEGAWIQQWSVRPPIEAETQVKSADVRQQRNSLLTACDWTQTLDAPVDRQAWSIYRQQLRDITAQGGFPWEVEWPSMPA